MGKNCSFVSDELGSCFDATRIKLLERPRSVPPPRSWVAPDSLQPPGRHFSSAHNPVLAKHVVTNDFSTARRIKHAHPRQQHVHLNGGPVVTNVYPLCTATKTDLRNPKPNIEPTQANAQNIMLAEAAISKFNKENPGAGYVVAGDQANLLPISRVFIYNGPWFHCNFNARERNDPNGKITQFYAEIFYGRTLLVKRCCILSDASPAENSIDTSCGLCGGSWERGLKHPPDVLGNANWLRWCKEADSFAQRVVP